MQSRSHIAPRLGRLLQSIQGLCPLYLLLRPSRLPRDESGRQKGEIFVDRYVLGCLGLAMLLYPISFLASPFRTLNILVASVVMLLSLWRILEVLAFHLGELLSRASSGKQVSIASFERTFVLALANYLEVTLWFASWYSIMLQRGAFQSAPSPLFLSIFRESLAMMLVNSSGLFVPAPSRMLWTILCFQSMVGLFMTLVVVSRVIAVLPGPTEE
jgi:hypothetical protein